MSYHQGDIVLIPFPFTDLTNTKKRPAIILSKDSINHTDYIVAQVTSTPRADIFTFKLDPRKLDTPTPSPSQVRTNKLFTVNHSLIIKKFSTLDKDELKLLIGAIVSNIEVEE